MYILCSQPNKHKKAKRRSSTKNVSKPIVGDYGTPVKDTAAQENAEARETKQDKNPTHIKIPTNTLPQKTNEQKVPERLSPQKTEEKMTQNLHGQMEKVSRITSENIQEKIPQNMQKKIERVQTLERVPQETQGKPQKIQQNHLEKISEKTQPTQERAPQVTQEKTRKIQQKPQEKIFERTQPTQERALQEKEKTFRRITVQAQTAPEKSPQEMPEELTERTEERAPDTTEEVPSNTSSPPNFDYPRANDFTKRMSLGGNKSKKKHNKNKKRRQTIWGDGIGFIIDDTIEENKREEEGEKADVENQTVVSYVAKKKKRKSWGKH